MAGKLINSKYKTDDDRIFQIRTAPATALLAFGSQQNAPPVGGVTEPEPTVLRRDVSERGLKTRKVILVWTDVVPPGYSPTGRLPVPILTPEIFAAIQLDQECLYRGFQAKVVSKQRERN